MHFIIYFLFKIFRSFFRRSLYISGILLANILLIFIFKNLEINFIDSLNNKSEISFVLHILIKISTKVPMEGDLYSHLLHT